MPIELYLVGFAGLALFGLFLYRCVGLGGPLPHTEVTHNDAPASGAQQS